MFPILLRDRDNTAVSQQLSLLLLRKWFRNIVQQRRQEALIDIHSPAAGQNDTHSLDTQDVRDSTARRPGEKHGADVIEEVGSGRSDNRR